jgi:hypothetical protein
MAEKSNAQQFRLIQGTFSPEEANQLLMTLIQDKLKFHQRNNASRRERFGEKDAAVEARIEALRQTRTDLSAFIDEASAVGKTLAISCNIEITLEPE